MIVLSRIITVANEIELTADDLAIITANPAPFEITTLSQLTMAGVRALWTYKQLERDFNDTEGRLGAYFATKDVGNCDTSPKMAILSKLTGWSISQSCVLRQALYGTGEGYNTVMGVAHMQSCFVLGDTTGLDINGLLQMAVLNTLPATMDNSGRWVG